MPADTGFSRSRGKDEAMTTPLDRLQTLRRATAEMGLLPYSVRVEGARVTRDGEDLVVLHEDRTERFREGEVSTGGVAGFFGRMKAAFSAPRAA